MSVKSIAEKQSAQLLDNLSGQLSNIQKPTSGWLVVLRKALGMTGAQLSRRLGVTRAAIHQAERNERESAISLKQLEKIAEAMDARLVYVIVPKDNVETIIRRQAQKKAKKTVRKAGSHMALENQSLSEAELQSKIKELTEELIRDRPSDFWEN